MFVVSKPKCFGWDRTNTWLKSELTQTQIRLYRASGGMLKVGLLTCSCWVNIQTTFKLERTVDFERMFFSVSLLISHFEQTKDSCITATLYTIYYITHDDWRHVKSAICSKGLLYSAVLRNFLPYFCLLLWLYSSKKFTVLFQCHSSYQCCLQTWTL